MPRIFKLEIELGNDAMKTRAHVENALVRVANKLRAGGLKSARILDNNGNTVGRWEFTQDDPGDDA